MTYASVVPFEQLPTDIQDMVSSIMSDLGIDADGQSDDLPPSSDDILDDAALTVTSTAINMIFDAHETLRKADELLTAAERLCRLVDEKSEEKRSFLFDVMESILPAGVMLEEAIDEIEEASAIFAAGGYAEDEKASQVH